MEKTPWYSSCLLTILIAISLACSVATASTTITTDKAALLALMATPTTPKTHWQATGQQLPLIVNGLESLAFHFTRDLPPVLVHLNRLRYVHMSVNKFSGEIPTWLGLLPNLQYLNLANNSFTSSLPFSLSNAARVETLQLSYNSLQGMIPNEFGYFRSLRIFAIENDNLIGPIPSTISNISSLEVLAFADNNLSGNLSTDICRNLQNLTVLSLAYNNFVGSVPREIGQLNGLQELYLGANNLSGVIPQEVGNLHYLIVLAMEHTLMSGKLPLFIFNLTSLELLGFSFNQMTRPIPQEVGRLAMLQHLQLGVNEFTGVIPEEIANLTRLVDLQLQANDLSGSIPVGIFNISPLTTVALNYNQLSGVLPSTIGYGLPNLQILFLEGNNLIGVSPNFISGSSQLPELSFITSLTSSKSLLHLSMGDNPLNGALPETVGQLSTNQKLFSAYNCQIKGGIPEEIGNLSSLIDFSLDNNELNGTIPTTMGRLRSFQRVYINDNQLTGPIPTSFCNLQRMGILSLSNNLLSGSIPDCLDNVTAQRYLYLEANRLTANIPSSFWNLADVLELRLSSNYFAGSLPLEISNLRVVTYLDLSINNFSGNVPSSIGDLQHLVYLSLARNNLQGPIPESIGSIVTLEVLNLSQNNLSDSIPKSVEKLKYLVAFNVSFNDLRGEIPSGGHFKNFTTQSFLPNGALCAEDPIFRVPSCAPNSAHESRRGKRVLLYTLPVVAALLLSLAFLSLLYIYRKRKQRKSSVLGQTEEILGLKRKFSYYEIQQATEGYSNNNLLGTGSFGSVYRGIVKDGTVIAVKVFNLQIDSAFKSFDTECEVLRNLRHRNLTKIISSCSNEDFKALILEYMPNGSLDKWLYSENRSLSMVQRLDIMIDVANGLEYLHHGYDAPVVHCDLKPSNVLLDDSMVAHLSDFGIAKLLDDEDNFCHTKTLATFGYMAPEYGREGLVSTRCDVYSFGILLMETFTRRRPNAEMFDGNLSMRQWINISMPNSLIEVADASLFRAEDELQIEKLQCLKSIMELALNCTEEYPGERPEVKDALAALKRIRHRLVAIMQIN